MSFIQKKITSVFLDTQYNFQYERHAKLCLFLWNLFEFSRQLKHVTECEGFSGMQSMYILHIEAESEMSHYQRSKRGSETSLKMYTHQRRWTMLKIHDRIMLVRFLLGKYRIFFANFGTFRFLRVYKIWGEWVSYGCFEVVIW